MSLRISLPTQRPVYNSVLLLLAALKRIKIKIEIETETETETEAENSNS